MIIPIVPHEELVDENKFMTKAWGNYVQQQSQNMQQCLSNEGYVVPSQTLANMNVIAAAVDSHGSKRAIPGTLIFRTDIANGATPPSMNGQLYILLADGVFHPITNT